MLMLNGVDDVERLILMNGVDGDVEVDVEIWSRRCLYLILMILMLNDVNVE